MAHEIVPEAKVSFSGLLLRDLPINTSARDYMNTEMSSLCFRQLGEETKHY